jgi:cyclophilin family peptidyl-prolyl cis-trans isomerase
MKYALSLSMAAAATVILLGQGCSKPAATNTDPYSSLPYSQAKTETSTKTEPTAPTPTAQEPTQPSPKPTMATTLTFPGVLPESETRKTVKLNTTQGVITISVMPDQGPKAASNFVYLAKQGFFNGLTFHRYVEGFVIQGGDPKGNGTGGPGYQFEDDPVKPVGQNNLIAEGPMPGYVLYKRGTVAMANAGKNTNGSQFFIMIGDAPLAPGYSIFGQVTAGMDAVDKIRIGDKMTSVTVE